jgi:hypothetical protein
VTTTLKNQRGTTLYPSFAEYACDDGYTLRSDVVVGQVCQLDGSWKGNPGACKPLQCASLLPILELLFI